MYRKWIKPRLAKVIAAAKAIKPDILISYHSCGYILPFIEDLIDVGVDILNPVQPECMDFAEVHAKFGDTAFVQRHAGHAEAHALRHAGADQGGSSPQPRDRAGPRGGLFCCPTHMLEPEVPWANIEAYVEAVREFQPVAKRKDPS